MSSSTYSGTSPRRFTDVTGASIDDPDEPIDRIG
jgi:hypothetical protein